MSLPSLYLTEPPGPTLGWPPLLSEEEYYLCVLVTVMATADEKMSNFV